MSTVAGELRCKGCGAQVVFEVLDRAFCCPHCSHTEAPEMPQLRGVEELDLEVLLELEQSKGQPLDELTLSCQSCGAQTAHSSQVKVVDCPFCASTKVRDEKDNPSVFQPIGVLPFELSPEQASILIRRWARSLWFRPGWVSRLSHLDELQGCYIPVWTVDARVMVDYTARRRGTREVPGKEVGESYDEPFEGLRKANYDDLLISASRGVPKLALQNLEPFSTITGLVAYDPRYLSGFRAEESQMGPREAWAEAELHLREVELAKCKKESVVESTDVIEMQRIDFTFSQRKGKPVFLPIYVAAYRKGTTVYRVLVNGETGRVHGEAPFSPWKVLLLVLALLGVGVATIGSMGMDVPLLLLVAVVVVISSHAQQQREQAILNAPARYVPNPGAPAKGAPSSAEPASRPEPPTGPQPRWKTRGRNRS